MATFEFTGSFEGVRGKFMVGFEDIDELRDVLKTYEFKGVTFDSEASASDPKQPTCPTHGETLLPSKRKPNTLFCPHNDNGRYCQYELKQG